MDYSGTHLVIQGQPDPKKLAEILAEAKMHAEPADDATRARVLSERESLLDASGTRRMSAEEAKTLAHRWSRQVPDLKAEEAGALEAVLRHELFESFRKRHEGRVSDWRADVEMMIERCVLRVFRNASEERRKAVIQALRAAALK